MNHKSKGVKKNRSRWAYCTHIEHGKQKLMVETRGGFEKMPEVGGRGLEANI